MPEVHAELRRLQRAVLTHGLDSHESDGMPRQIGPVAWADSLFKVKRGQAIGWRQGFGIIFDDLVAALCTLMLIAIWRWL